MVFPRGSTLRDLMARVGGLPGRMAGYYRVDRMCGSSRRAAIGYAVTYGVKSLRYDFRRSSAPRPPTGGDVGADIPGGGAV